MHKPSTCRLQLSAFIFFLLILLPAWTAAPCFAAYVDNGDGTVTDTATGLMWQQQDDGSSRNWSSALTYAEGLTLAGYAD